MKIGGVNVKSHERLDTLPQALSNQDHYVLCHMDKTACGKLSVACKCTVSMLPIFDVK